MWSYKVLRNDGELITDGLKSWYELSTALAELGSQNYELVCGWRNDYKSKVSTPVGLREDVITEREMLLKRQTNPAKSFMDRILKR